MTLVCLIPYGDTADKARAIWKEKGMEGACVIADAGTIRAWQFDLGAYYLVGKDGRFAAHVLHDLPTAAHLAAAGAAP